MTSIISKGDEATDDRSLDSKTVATSGLSVALAGNELAIVSKGGLVENMMISDDWDQAHLSTMIYIFLLHAQNACSRASLAAQV